MIPDWPWLALMWLAGAAVGSACGYRWGFTRGIDAGKWIEKFAQLQRDTDRVLGRPIPDDVHPLDPP